MFRCDGGEVLQESRFEWGAFGNLSFIWSIVLLIEL